MKGASKMADEKKLFADLEKVRLDILQKKINAGFLEFENRPQIQWISLALEKPLLETLAKVIQKNVSLVIEVEHLRVMAANCECEEEF